jgi:hypothetical protein
LQIQDPHAKISERSTIDADFQINFQINYQFNFKIHVQVNLHDFAQQPVFARKGSARAQITWNWTSDPRALESLGRSPLGVAAPWF